ncbi:MAG: hypothetical protein WBH47_06590 [Streptosporangiaceae bacterium]
MTNAGPIRDVHAGLRRVVPLRHRKADWIPLAFFAVNLSRQSAFPDRVLLKIPWLALPLGTVIRMAREHPLTRPAPLAVEPAVVSGDAQPA